MLLAWAQEPAKLRWQTTKFLTLSLKAAPCHSGQQPASLAFGSGPAQRPALPSGSGSAPGQSGTQGWWWGAPHLPTHPSPLWRWWDSNLISDRQGPCSCAPSLPSFYSLFIYAFISQLIPYYFHLYGSRLRRCPSLPAQGLRTTSVLIQLQHSVCNT